jgi:hypothetical protein
MFKFEPSSITYAIILFFKPYPSKDQSSFFSNAYHIFSKTSNKPNVTWFSFQSNPKKLWPKQTHHERPYRFKDQTSTDKMALFKQRKNMCAWFFPLGKAKQHMWKNLHDKNWTYWHKCNIKHFSHTSSTNCKGK